MALQPVAVPEKSLPETSNEEPATSSDGQNLDENIDVLPCQDVGSDNPSAATEPNPNQHSSHVANNNG